MSRNKEEQARLYGMDYALKIAKEHGIEYLEKDLKKRGAYNIPVGVSQKSLKEFTTNVKNNVMDAFVVLTAVTLHDEFGFGQKRVQQFIERFEKKSECLIEDYTTWEDQINIIKEELGIVLDIRKNDTDVKI